jgi:hypothetical protein
VDTWTLLHTFADDATYASTATKWQEYLDGQANGTPPFTLAISWEDTAAFTGLLDTYSGAAAAYSLRLLDSTYTGDAIRVRRASDNTEQDIGFDGNGDLDTSALATFCAGTDGFVKVWYDQSGNANHATQSTTANQPKIYDASTGVIEENGKAAIYADGTKQMSISNISTVASNYYVFDLTKRDRTAETADGLRNDGFQSFGGGDLLIFDPYSTGALYANSYRTPAFSSSNLTIKTFGLVSGSGNLNVYENGFLHLNGTYTQVTMQGAIRLFHERMIGSRSELIIYTSDQSANRAGIESNISTYYGI